MTVKIFLKQNSMFFQYKNLIFYSAVVLLSNFVKSDSVQVPVVEKDATSSTVTSPMDRRTEADPCAQVYGHSHSLCITDSSNKWTLTKRGDAPRSRKGKDDSVLVPGR